MRASRLSAARNPRTPDRPEGNDRDPVEDVGSADGPGNNVIPFELRPAGETGPVAAQRNLPAVRRDRAEIAIDSAQDAMGDRQVLQRRMRHAETVQDDIAADVVARAQRYGIVPGAWNHAASTPRIADVAAARQRSVTEGRRISRATSRHSALSTRLAQQGRAPITRSHESPNIDRRPRFAPTPVQVGSVLIS